MTAIVFEVHRPQDTNQKDGRASQRVVLVDDSYRCVTLTLWGELSRLLDNKEGKCVSFDEVSTRNCRGIRTLTTLSRSRLQTMENFPAKDQICPQQWWNNGGLDEEFEELLLKEE